MENGTKQTVNVINKGNSAVAISLFNSLTIDGSSLEPVNNVLIAKDVVGRLSLSCFVF